MRIKALLNALLPDFDTVVNRSDEMGANRYHILLFGLCSTAAGVLIGGNFYTGLLLLLDADDSFIGLLNILVLACNFLGILSPLLLERFAQRKRLIIGSRVVLYLFNIVLLGLLPFLGLATPVRLSLFMVFVCMLNIISALFSSGYSVWHIQSIPRQIRAQHFSIHNTAVGTFSLVLGFGAGALVDAFKGRGLELWGLTALRILALGFAALDLWLLSRIREYPYTAAPQKLNIVRVFTNPFKQPRYLAVVAMISLWSIAASMPGPHYTVYLLKEVGVSYGYLNLIGMINIPVLLFVTPLWTRFIRRWGDIQWFAPVMAVLSLHYMSLLFVSQRTYMVLYPLSVLFFYLVYAGIAQIGALLPYRFIPEGGQSNYLSFYSAMVMLMSLVGASLGQLLVTRLADVSLVVLGVQVGAKQLLMAFTGGTMLLAAGVMALVCARLRRSAGGLDD